MPAHSLLTGADLHEPKGVASAASGQVYVANGSGSGTWTTLTVSDVWTKVHKATTESRTSNITMTADSDLFFSVLANTSYLVRGNIYCSVTNATPDIKFDFDIPASPVYNVAHLFVSELATSATPTTSVLQAYRTTIGIDNVLNAAGNTGYAILFECSFLTGAASGTFSFRWAQNTSDVNAVSVNRGSYIQYIKI